ncbi:MAG: NAD(P)H-dependent oxidoreductase [Pseudomonadota bacterium]
MAHVLIVVTHPDPESFTARWAAATATGLQSAGHTVAWSDLYAQGFDPVAGFDTPQGRGEVEKLKAADHIVLHFPLWWYGPPAMLKGWVDQVLVPGETVDANAPFEAGPCRGKRALFCVSVDVPAQQCGPSGRSGDARLQLWPLAHAFRFAGMDLLEPYLVPGIEADLGPARRIMMDAQIAQVLNDTPRRMAAMDRLPIWATNPAADFDTQGQLRPGAAVFSPFIRHDDGS